MSNGEIRVVTDVVNRDTFVFRVMQSKRELLLELHVSNIQEGIFFLTLIWLFRM
jgi:hypothetical protein